MTHKNIVDEVFSEKAKNDSNSKDLANMLNILTKTVFGDINRFVFELLQNADDSPISGNSAGVDVMFRISGDYLIFSHNGKQFDENDVRGISGIGNRQSKKDTDIEKTGYKGIGFKSVFGGSDQVYILSGGYSFRFDKNYPKWLNNNEYPWQVIPIWNEEPLPTFASELDSLYVHTIIAIKDAVKIKWEIENVFQDCQIMLFLRHIKSVTFLNNTKHVFRIEKRQTSSGIIELCKDKGLLSQWMVKDFFIPISADLTAKLMKLADEECPRKLKEATSTKLTFAAKIQTNEIIEEKNALIYCYLPTKVIKGFPFLINGDFITNAERSDLLQNIWNEFLFSEIALKSFDWIKELQHTVLQFQVLKLLRTKFSGATLPTELSFNKSLETAVKSVSFLPEEKANNSLLITNSIVDNTGFAQVFDPALISAHLKTTAAVVDTRMEKPGILIRLGAQTFTIDDLCKLVSYSTTTGTLEAFLNSYIEIIEFFYTKIEKEKLDDWNIKLKETAFIPDENLKLKTPKEVFFPLTEEHEEDLSFITLSIIHNQIIKYFQKKPAVFSWLHSLGVKEPSLLEIVRKSIIPIIQKDGINNNNSFAITRFVFRVYSSGSLADKDYLELLKLKLITNNGLYLPSQSYMPDAYGPDQKLASILPAANFVSQNYPETSDVALNWKPFLKKLGVNDNLAIIVDTSRQERTNFSKRYPFAEAYFNWLDDNDYYPDLYKPWKLSTQHGIINFTFIEFRQHLNVYAFSKTFWKSVLNGWDTFLSQCSSTQYYYRGGSTVVPSYVEYYIKNEASIPCTDEKCYKATEVYHPSLKSLTNGFFPVADIESNLTKEQNLFFEFKTSISFENCLDILTSLSAVKVKTEHIKQINAVYEELIAMANDITVDQLEVFNNWKAKATVLCLDNSFQLLETLYYFNSPGTNKPVNSQYFIKLSNDFSYPQIEKLCNLFDIEILSSDKLLFEANTPIEDTELKSVLLNIVKYLALVITQQYHEKADSAMMQLTSKLNSTSFHRSNGLNLVYRNADEDDIYNSKIDSWFDAEKSAFYFVGQWDSPLTLYSLGGSLCAFLEINRLERELTLMLQLKETEIAAWLRSLGYTIETNLGSLVEEETIKIEGETTKMEESTEENLTVQYETFIQKVAPAEIDYTDIQPEIKTFEMINVSVVNDKVYGELKGQQAKIDVGRWSEEFINNYFLRNQDIFSFIKWENETAESGLPYDFKIIENGIEKVVEVKGTPSSDKITFPISPAEWKIMFEKGINYIIFRVYGAGTENYKFERIDNPAEKIQLGMYLPNPLNLQI